MGLDHPRFLLHEHLEECARRLPRGTALLEGDRTVTFSDLEARADRVAAGLGSRGIRPGASVGLHIERSIDWVVGILGILKANGAVVPLTPSNPPGWKRDILAFADLDAVVDRALSPLDPSLTRQTLRLEELESGLETSGGPSPGDPHQPAFVLCSSGSTGRPKMIVRSHRSFFHRLRWTWDQHPFGAEEVGCQKAHMTTTHAIYELFEPLLCGARVAIIPDQDVRDLEGFWETIRARGISRLLMVPSAMRATLDMPGFLPPPLKVLVLMGEHVPESLAERTLAAFSADTRIFSIYGSTEASSTLVSDLREDFRPGEDLPLGKPLSPEVLHRVLDPDLQPVPRGHTGRLYMGGSPLFSQYFRDPELTASAFVTAPGEPKPLFDMQDRVRVTEEGHLQYEGRADDTVKIRGFRVSLPEVERAILSHPGVGQTTVLMSDEDGRGDSLIAFVLPEAVDRESLFRGLRDRLPAYMVPSVLVALQEFPLTSSGKVDRVGLLEGFRARAPGSSLSSDLSETESRIRGIWEMTLGHGNFQTDDSFFEVGGTSLTVFSLIIEMRKALGLDRSQLKEQSVYRYPTIRGLSGFIDALQEGRTKKTPDPTPLLVTLRKGKDGAKAPFFLVASAGGTLGAYEKLARALDTPREIVGIRDPFTWGERDPTGGFQRWIDAYVEAIRQRQPRGPFFLGAYSSAGAFGLEVARRLRQEGEEVALLALIDPLALDRRNRWRYGYWALRATWMRPPFRALVRLWGWCRSPVVRLWKLFGSGNIQNDHALSPERFRHVERRSLQNQRHLISVAALLELNTGLPFALTEEDFAGRSPEEYPELLRSRLATLTPDVDWESMERILVQYDLQLLAQHAYQLQPYDGPVLLVEPTTRHTGLLKALFRPYLKNTRVRTVELGPAEGRVRDITERFGALEAHYRSMRDDQFVEGLAKELDPFLL